MNHRRRHYWLLTFTLLVLIASLARLATIEKEKAEQLAQLEEERDSLELELLLGKAWNDSLWTYTHE